MAIGDGDVDRLGLNDRFSELVCNRSLGTCTGHSKSQPQHLTYKCTDMGARE